MQNEIKPLMTGHVGVIKSMLDSSKSISQSAKQIQESTQRLNEATKK